MRIRSYRKLGLLMWLAISIQSTMLEIRVLGVECPVNPPLPSLDQRNPTYPNFTDPDQQVALSQLRSNVAGVRIASDAILGVPRSVSSVDMSLTPLPQVVGPLAPNMVKSVVTPTDPYEPVKTFLTDYAPLFGQGADLLTNTVIRQDYVTAHNGLRTTVWQQSLDGVGVYQAMMVANVTKESQLASISSRLVPSLLQAVNNSVPDHVALVAAPPVSAAMAVAQAASNIGVVVSTNDLASLGAPVGAEKKQFFTSPQLRGKTSVRLIWLPMSRNTLRLCWNVVVSNIANAYTYEVLVDAQTTEVLVRRSLVRFLSDATYNVFTSDSPSPYSPGCPTPCTTQPPVVSRSLVVTSAVSVAASPNGWINDGDNQTIGNNADVSTDLDGNLTPDPSHPTGSPNRVFDFPLDLSQDPSTYSTAAAVQMFYWLNWAHDKMYDLGFTESAGNFQQNNFGKGGVGGDPVLGCAQSAAVQDNAFMMTQPTDGLSPTMVMGLFTGPTPLRDSDLDAEILMHEYNHGVQDRVVGGGVGVTYAAQPGGLMEGWSDFNAMALLSEPGDDPDGVYAGPGAYSAYQIVPGYNQNYYFGIRRYPYTTDMTKNPLTFKDIDPTQASPHSGVPINPIGLDANGADEVHNAGEVWCVTLWEVRANLIKKYGHVIGNQLMLRLVLDGMKLSPADPTWIEARDAILLADRINNNNANLAELWTGFAKRGLGYSASAPPSDTNTGVVEAFDVPAFASACFPSTVSSPADQPQCVTRTARFWFTHVYSADTNCATLYKAIEANGGNLCLGFVKLAVNYENDDAVKDSADTLIEAMGLYWRNQGLTGEPSGTQSDKMPGSSICRARKVLAAELIAAIANNVLLGTTPGNCNAAFPSDLIEQAGQAAGGDDPVAMKTMTVLLRQFNSSGVTNQLPYGLQECSVYGSKNVLKSVSRDPMTHDSCPGRNDSCASATPVAFSVNGDILSFKAIFKDKLNLTKYMNALDSISTNNMGSGTNTNVVVSATNLMSNVCAPIGHYAVWRISSQLGQAGRDFTVSTYDSNFDTVIAVYKGTCSPERSVTCNDNDPIYMPQSKVTFTTDGTNTYFVVVGGKNYSAGSLKVRITSP